jgi:hypothetical protein
MSDDWRLVDDDDGLLMVVTIDGVCLDDAVKLWLDGMLQMSRRSVSDIELPQGRRLMDGSEIMVLLL